MKVLIIEDEIHNAKRLHKILEEIDDSIEVLGILEGVEESILWFKSNVHPDLTFMDVRLADGLSFDIFTQVDVTCPIIFTSAFDEYALRAFKVNSVDYLLKPINKRELAKSIEKYTNSVFHSISKSSLNDTLEEIANKLSRQQKSYRTRFLLPIKDSYITVLVENISYFYIDLKTVKAILFDGKTVIIPFSMEDLEEQLNPESFFRANRQYIINSKCIKKISNYFNGKLSVVTYPVTEEKLVISRDKARAFKEWLDK